MPIPASGPLSMTDIQTEFGGANPIGLNEYYAGGANVPAGTSGTFGAVPSSGAISIQNFYGTAKAVPFETVFSAPGTYSWIAPADAASVSVVAVGGGGGGGPGFLSCYAYGGLGASGGGLGYRNNITVVPGTSYTVVVGAGGAPRTNPNNRNPGFESYFISTATVRGGGAAGGSSCVNSPGGTFTGDGGGDGGRGFGFSCSVGSGGGGGAGGYSGSGGNGANTGASTASTGGGGGGGGRGFNAVAGGGGGGGTGLYGLGANGTAGANGPANTDACRNGRGGGGGSGGSSSATIVSGFTGGNGGIYGGGGGGGNATGATAGAGGNGAVRIVGPGSSRQFPSTCVGVPASGSVVFDNPGTYSWVAPAGVTSVSIVAVGAGFMRGGVCAGGGGALGYQNNITVTPGTAYRITVAKRGNPSSYGTSTSIVIGGTTYSAGSASFGTGGSTRVNMAGGGNGGQGSFTGCCGGGGGGAGGYSGNGGNGRPYSGSPTAGTAGTGGAGGGGGRAGASPDERQGGGGGVGLFGEGASGAVGGFGGSGGANATYANGPSMGGNYGGGGGTGNGDGCCSYVNKGSGALRIVWPGNTRTFPSTNVGAP